MNAYSIKTFKLKRIDWRKKRKKERKKERKDEKLLTKRNRIKKERMRE